MTTLSLTIEKLIDTDIDVLRRLAQKIWYAHYSTILSNEQIEYMLGIMYGIEVIEREIHDEGILYDKVLQSSELVGFLSYGREAKENSNRMKLHKCYLSPALHGVGYGQIMLAHISNEGRKMGFSEVVLNVNKQNAKAIKAYQKFGFKIIGAEINDIGRGFVMDDYVMGYNL